MLAVGDLEDLGGEGVTEVVVVGNVEDGAVVAEEGLLELLDAWEVEVRGGFVEDEESGVVGEHGDDLEAGFLATREIFDENIAVGVGEKIVGHELADAAIVDDDSCVLVEAVDGVWEEEVEVPCVDFLVVDAEADVRVEVGFAVENCKRTAKPISFRERILRYSRIVMRSSLIHFSHICRHRCFQSLGN